jgi:UDP-2-acetamido-3-amino-2,3-dideoxy-glucuronate N-acetyltransferase
MCRSHYSKSPGPDAAVKKGKGQDLNGYRSRTALRHFRRHRDGEGTRIGNFVFIRENTIIGNCCIVGSYLDIEGDVRIGDFVSLQSGCYITRGVVIESEVCCGSGIITMNDKAITYHRPSLTFKRQAPRIFPAARISGGSILCPGVTVGENALVGAGSVVTRDVPDRIIVAGNPAVAIGSVPDNEVI